MDLSVIIPSHNEPELIARLLRSLQEACPPKLGWEVLVVDNNSSSDVIPTLREIVGSFSLPLRHLSEPMTGKSRAVNLGIREARGKFTAFLDHDVVAHPGYLVGIEESIARFPHKVFGGRVLPVWPSPPPKWVTGGQPLRTSRGPIVAHDYGDSPRPYDGNMRLPVGCNFFCQRALFEQYGLFDVRLGPGSGKGHMGGEEIQLLSRFRAGGERIFYTPVVAVDHPVEPERMTKAFFRYRVFCAGRSSPYIVQKTFPSLFGIPRFLYRRLATTVLRNLAALVSFNSIKIFDRQLDLCEIFGVMYEYRRLHCNGFSLGGKVAEPMDLPR